MKKLRRYDISDPIFSAPLSFFIGDIDEFKKYIDRTPLKDEVEFTKCENGKHIFNHSKSYNIIWLSKFNVGCLAHELIHMTFSVFASRNIPINIDNDEVFTYYNQMMMNKILDKLKVKTK